MSSDFGARLPFGSQPTLRPGIDRLPTRCNDCGSNLLSSEPPLGRDRFGTMSCTLCGRTICFLAHLLPPPAAVRPRAQQAPAPRLTSRPPAPLSTAEWRLPGCTVACLRGQHSPEAHERYGFETAVSQMMAPGHSDEPVTPPPDRVATGRLCVDVLAGIVTVDGIEVSLSPKEYAVLAYLAGRIGQLCSHEEIVRAVWGADQLLIWKPMPHSKQWHGLRIQFHRMTMKLGSARDLVVNVKCRGYRLRAEPPVGGEA